MMKKERLIKVKSPFLRKLRSNLRILLQEASLHRDLKIGKGKHRSNIINESICACASGGGCVNLQLPVLRFHRTDLDMAYVPFLKKWFCVDCYTEIKKREDYLRKGADPNYILPYES